LFLCRILAATCASSALYLGKEFLESSLHTVALCTPISFAIKV